jgi:hypothetical protein
MKANYAHIHILFDRSGSMGGREKDVQNWYKVFIDEQKKVSGECTLSLATFDTQGYDTVVEWSDIRAVSSEFNLQPRGGTPLLDSVGRSIEELGLRLAKMPEEQRPSKVIVVIQTDGEENSSRKYTLEKLNALITQQRNVYGWDFMFLGADIDAYSDASKLGVSTFSTASYGNNAKGYYSLAVNSSAAISRARVYGVAATYTIAEQKEMEATKDTAETVVSVTP